MILPWSRMRPHVVSHRAESGFEPIAVFYEHIGLDEDDNPTVAIMCDIGVVR